MRYRDNKCFYAGSVCHVYNRGVNKEDIFKEVADYSAFLLRLGILLGLPKPANSRLHIQPFERGDFTLFAYCLMPNHFHFQIRQNGSVAIGELVHKLCTSYGMYFNRKYERLGSVWQDTFKAKDVTDDPYMLVLNAYIHNNPIDPNTYSFSSYKDYLGVRTSRLCDTSFVLGMFKNSVNAYTSFVEGWRVKDPKKFLFWEEHQKGHPFKRKG